ncbi:MAG: DUF1796 family putative cysteine peptidase [Leptolyngbyaceae bacterium]|nr:DUF1796 family putative cysteine peptidase [Leptolyngbyaceae bacterium]
MYRFQIRAFTRPGETIALVGSIPEMGLWDVKQCVRLRTQGNLSPLWWVDLDLSDPVLGAASVGVASSAENRPAEYKIQYKYVRIGLDGKEEWEAWGSNRWVPIESQPLPSPVIVEDSWFGSIPTYPYGYFSEPVVQPPKPQSQDGLKVVVIGSSVALGCSAWLLRGWAWHLGQALQHHYGHQLVNVSEIGTNVGTTIARFPHVVVPEKPDIVIISLSLGNEGLASSPPQQHRSIQRRFENGLQQLVKMTRELGALPILGGVYPNGDYSPEQYVALQDTHQRLLSWDIPVLDWLTALDNGQGRWKPGISFDSAHPNTEGHRLMYEAMDLTLFRLTKANLETQLSPQPSVERTVYLDKSGFHVLAHKAENTLRVINTTPYPYTFTPGWQDFQAAAQAARLSAGLYIAESPITKTVRSLFVQEDGTIATTLTIPPAADWIFYPAFHFFAPHRSQILFYDGHLSILKVINAPGEMLHDLATDIKPADRLYLINTSDHEYNIQPMWKEVRAALKAMPTGVYEDPGNPNTPFRTLMIGNDGLESRVKAPAQSAMVLEYKCSLSEVSRVAILPLGDRCAVRMLLYKLEYDGPAFPFDLTRSTNLADVADMIQNGFHDMWNPAFLHYNHEARRIYHTKWTGLSFAHEVEEDEDPVNDMSPVYERMRTRYSARSSRFWYTLQKCDKVLFVRTGLCDRGTVMDLVYKLEAKCQEKPFRLLIISPQDSYEFRNLPNVVHYNLEFNPDRMYEDLGYWLDCTETMRGILNSLGVSSKNLFWCPPNLPK